MKIKKKLFFISFFLTTFFAMTFNFYFFKNSPSGQLSSTIIHETFKKCFFQKNCNETIKWPTESFDWDYVYIFNAPIGFGETGMDLIGASSGFNAGLSLLFFNKGKEVYREAKFLEASNKLFGAGLKYASHQLHFPKNKKILMCPRDSSIKIISIELSMSVNLQVENCLEILNVSEFTSIKNGLNTNLEKKAFIELLSRNGYLTPP